MVKFETNLTSCRVSTLGDLWITNEDIDPVVSKFKFTMLNIYNVFLYLYPISRSNFSSVELSKNNLLYKAANLAEITSSMNNTFMKSYLFVKNLSLLKISVTYYVVKFLPDKDKIWWLCRSNLILQSQKCFRHTWNT